MLKMDSYSNNSTKSPVDIKRTISDLTSTFVNAGNAFKSQLKKFIISTEQPADQARREAAKSNYFVFFVILSAICAIIEPFLVAHSPVGLNYIAQIVVLSVSTFLYLISIIITYYYLSKNQELTFPNCQSKLISCFDGEAVLEGTCLLLGWILFTALEPGIAAVRCFRILRYIWYFELLTKSDKVKKTPPAERFVNIFEVAHLCLKYLERIGIEIFTAKSKGGIVVLFLFFYITYIMSVIIWNRDETLITIEGYATCGRLSTCFIIMLRLAFYDSTGFDFITATMSSGQIGITLLLFFYLIFSSIILLNGLIGIFSNAFTTDNENEMMKIQKDIKIKFILKDILNDLKDMNNDIYSLKYNHNSNNNIEFSDSNPMLMNVSKLLHKKHSIVTPTIVNNRQQTDPDHDGEMEEKDVELLNPIHQTTSIPTSNTTNETENENENETKNNQTENESSLDHD